MATPSGGDAEPSVKKLKTGARVLRWIKVQDLPRLRQVDLSEEMKTVEDLLQWATTGKGPKTTCGKHVDDLTLYTCENAEERKVCATHMMLAEIADGSPQNPWYLDYKVSQEVPRPSHVGIPASSSQALLHPSRTKAVTAPKLGDLKAGELLDVHAFHDFVVAGTTIDRPLYLRQHLIDVRNAAVDALKTKRLVSLVGCPGVGKTWCGLLVAHALHRQNKRTLHLTIRGNTAVAIARLSERREYDVDVFTFSMLKQAITEANCQVCVLDVGGVSPLRSAEVFQGARTLLESPAFSDVNIMGLLSGHGEETIIGKQSFVLPKECLIMWSWTAEDVDALSKKIDGIDGGAFAVCGGSVRHLFDVETDRDEIRRAVRQLDPAQIQALLKGYAPTSDDGHKQKTGLMSFLPRKDPSHFNQGTAAAILVPRSEYVIQCLQENAHTMMVDVAWMYRQLICINFGTAGSAFELMVHIFWRDKVQGNATVQLQLFKVLPTGTDGEKEELEVDCGKLAHVVSSIEDWDTKAGDPPLGYYTPMNPRYPVVDSILRFSNKDTVRVLAIQVSIGTSHAHADHSHKLLDNTGPKQLALWDYRDGGKACRWAPSESEHWQLCRIECAEFDKLLSDHLK